MLHFFNELLTNWFKNNSKEIIGTTVGKLIILG